MPTSLDLLRGFEAAARHLSFTSAGTELFLTQSAVSRQVQMLEEQLGVKLFERKTRALALTQPGALYYREVSRALQQLREATASVRADTSSIVRVTTPVTFAAVWLVPRLARFQSRFQEIAVHIAADNAIRDLERAGLDVAIRYSTAGAAGPRAIMLFGERVAAVCSPALLRANGAVRTIEDLLRLPLLHYEDPEGRTPWLTWTVWCEANGVTSPAAARGLRFSHYDQVMQAAIGGQGVALGRLPLVQPLIDQRKLAMPLRGKRYSTLAQDRAYWLIVSETAGRRAEVGAFVSWLREEIAGSGRSAGPRGRGESGGAA